MLFRSSPGTVVFLILLLRVMVLAQAPETVVAIVAGRDVTLKEVDEVVSPAVVPLQQQLSAIRRIALDNLIATRVLEREAQSQGVSTEELRRRLTHGSVTVTRAQVEEAYAQNASFFVAMSPDEARERLRLDLETQARMKNYREALDALRQKWAVSVKLLTPSADSDLDDGSAPGRGPARAPVTIVEFSDFECPYCRQVQETLKQILEQHGADVRLVFKHLPLDGHRNALAAARAAFCAGEQDRFWQLHDALFAAPTLSQTLIAELATRLGLNREKFSECLNAERSRTAVINDLETAKRYRIDGTPSFLINGKLVRGALTLTEFQNFIQRELQQVSTRKTSSTN